MWHKSDVDGKRNKSVDKINFSTFNRNSVAFVYQNPTPIFRISCHDGSLDKRELNKFSWQSEWKAQLIIPESTTNSPADGNLPDIRKKYRCWNLTATQNLGRTYGQKQYESTNNNESFIMLALIMNRMKMEVKGSTNHEFISTHI